MTTSEAQAIKDGNHTEEWTINDYGSSLQVVCGDFDVALMDYPLWLLRMAPELRGYANKAVSAVNGTYASGINPAAVKGLVTMLTKLKELIGSRIGNQDLVDEIETALSNALLTTPKNDGQ